MPVSCLFQSTVRCDSSVFEAGEDSRTCLDVLAALEVLMSDDVGCS